MSDVKEMSEQRFTADEVARFFIGDGQDVQEALDACLDAEPWGSDNGTEWVLIKLANGQRFKMTVKELEAPLPSQPFQESY